MLISIRPSLEPKCLVIPIDPGVHVSKGSNGCIQWGARTNLLSWSPQLPSQIEHDAAYTTTSDCLTPEVMSADTYSTAFSGVDTPGVAGGALSQAVNDLSATKVGRCDVASPPIHLHAIEWNPDCRAELFDAPQAAHCIYGNISEFFVPAIADWVNAMEKTQYPAWLTFFDRPSSRARA